MAILTSCSLDLGKLDFVVFARYIKYLKLQNWIVKIFLRDILRVHTCLFFSSKKTK